MTLGTNAQLLIIRDGCGQRIYKVVLLENGLYRHHRFISVDFGDSVHGRLAKADGVCKEKMVGGPVCSEKFSIESFARM